MKLLWEIEDDDIRKVKEFFDEHKDNDLVLLRQEQNVEKGFSRFSRDKFWREMVVCLMTTQARSGPNNTVSRFANQKPFPLRYKECQQRRSLKSFAQRTLARGGIRRNVTISEQIDENFRWLEVQGGWKKTAASVSTSSVEFLPVSRTTLFNFIDQCLKGFGPKQSRNLLQNLSLTRYEIPIDSRITRWLNDFGFPVSLSATASADLGYYKFVFEGFRELCDACDLYPCLLDAAIWSSRDN